MGRNKAFLWVMRTSGLISLAVFIVVKIPAPFLLEKSCRTFPEFGDLYSSAQVPFFKIRIPDDVGPPLVRTRSSLAGDRRVFVMGDSFMPYRRGHENYVATLSQRLSEQVFYEGWDVPSPVCIFSRLDSPINTRMKRIVVLESVERLVLERFSRIPECPAWMVENHRATRSLQALAQRVFEVVFSNPEARFQYFLLLNRAIGPAVEAFRSMRFRLLGIVADDVPVYSTSPPFLFLGAETDRDLPSSYYHPHDDALVERLAENVARIRDVLASRYNAELMFMPVPSKYTIYHHLINADPYDGFLPRLCDATQKRGVRTIRLYEKFAAEPGQTYYPTDAHWTPLGIEIAIAETLKVLADLR